MKDSLVIPSAFDLNNATQRAIKNGSGQNSSNRESQMNYMYGLDVKSVTHDLEMVGYVYDDSETLPEGIRAHYFYNDMFTLQIYSDIAEKAINSIEVCKFSIKGDKHSKQEAICITDKLDNGIFLIDDVPIEGVLEILYTTPNDEIIEKLRKLSIDKKLRKLSIDKMLEPLNHMKLPKVNPESTVGFRKQMYQEMDSSRLPFHKKLSTFEGACIYMRLALETYPGCRVSVEEIDEPIFKYLVTATERN